MSSQQPVGIIAIDLSNRKGSARNFIGQKLNPSPEAQPSQKKSKYKCPTSRISETDLGSQGNS